MVRFKAQGQDGRILLGFGLSNKNIKKLKKGEPILFSLEDFGYENTDMTIVAGDTEESLKDDFRRMGIKI